MKNSIEELEAVLDQGLRLGSKRRGLRRTIDAGRKSRSRRAPSEAELDRLAIVAGASRCSFLGPRNVAILRLMAGLGIRSMTLAAMDGADFERRRGVLFLWIREKGRNGQRQVEVPEDIVQLLERYVDAFNQWALEHRWSHRVGIGEPGAFWRGGAGKPVAYSGLLYLAQTSRSIAGVDDFHLHGLRHLRAGYLGHHLEIKDAALAGGWRAPGVFEKHYARPIRRFGPDDPVSGPPPEPAYWPMTDGGLPDDATPLTPPSTNNQRPG